MNSKLTERMTIYLTPSTRRFLQLRSIQENRPISLIINDRFAELLAEFEQQKDTQWRKQEEAKEWAFINKSKQS